MLLSVDDDEPVATLSEEPIKYVLSGQPTGWAAMAQVMRDFDQERLEDCKDDMDTLLVFVSTTPLFTLQFAHCGCQAGLFSGILSAFLVASYPNLQPDPSDRMIELLERIATQTSSYTFTGGMLNSSVPVATSVAAFTPAANNIRINVLWFASLLCGLISASFGILVKQWLREYTAVENPSPQARLRLRYVRYQELKKWKVFEIAAVLPLILQLALGLFFTGLCYLASSLHLSVSLTTLPLVIGWALCFIAITIMPLFFPRCPFKTTLLKAVLYRLHTSVYHKLRHWIKIHAEILHEKDIVGIDENDIDILVDVDGIQSNNELLATTIKEAALQITLSYEQTLTFISRIIQNRIPITSFFKKSNYVSFTEINDLPLSVVNMIYELIFKIPGVNASKSIYQSQEWIYALAILLSLPKPSVELCERRQQYLYNILSSEIQVIYNAFHVICYNDDAPASDPYTQAHNRIVMILQKLSTFQLTIEHRLTYINTMILVAVSHKQIRNAFIPNLLMQPLHFLIDKTDMQHLIQSKTLLEAIQVHFAKILIKGLEDSSSELQRHEYTWRQYITILFSNDNPTSFFKLFDILCDYASKFSAEPFLELLDGVSDTFVISECVDQFGKYEKKTWEGVFAFD